MDRSLKLARQTPHLCGFLARIRPVPGEIHPLRPPLAPGATVAVQNHRRLVPCEEASAPTPLDPLLTSSASAPCVGPAEATSSRAPLPLTRSSERAQSPVLGPDPRKAQPVPTHLLLSTERAKARKSSESVRSVRIRSTTLVCLLHGLNLLPSRISVAGTGNVML